MQDLVYALSGLFRSTEKINIDVTLHNKCPKCKGTGEVLPEPIEDFPLPASMPGSEQLREPMREFVGQIPYPCPRCDGDGSWITKGNLSVTNESTKPDKAKNKKP